MPIGSASAQVKSTVASEIRIVRPIRSPITSLTGFSCSIESPRLPCSRPVSLARKLVNHFRPTQRAYRLVIDSSRWKFLRRSAASWSFPLVPCIWSCAMRVSAKSPGGSCTSTKTITEMKNIVGIIRSRRRPMNGCRTPTRISPAPRPASSSTWITRPAELSAASVPSSPVATVFGGGVTVTISCLVCAATEGSSGGWSQK